MKIVYMKCAMSDIVHCEAPPGSKIFWPEGYPVPPTTKKGDPCWKNLETVKDTLAPRTRLITVASEIEDSPGRFFVALKKAWAKLPKSCQNRGLLGVTIKGDPYTAEGKQWRFIGFFYIPSAKAWKEQYDDTVLDWFTAPDGFPTQTWW